MTTLLADAAAIMIPFEQSVVFQVSDTLSFPETEHHGPQKKS